MRKLLQRWGALALVLLLTTLGCLWYARQKSGLFIDEIYTYGLSNSHFAPYLTDVAGGDARDGVLTRQQLFDYLTVGEDERFDFASVVYNQTQDVHPPLYYWLLNAVCSLTPGVFSYRSGLLLDLVIYLVAVALVYALAWTLYEDRLAAAVAALLYGLSAAGLSTMLMIRMYVLMTALSVLLAYLAAKLMKQPKRLYYPLFCLTLFLGLMTQYYFVFYAFFLCAGYVLWRLWRREWKQALCFALWAFAGVGLLVLAFPACLDQLFAEKLVSGGNAVENLTAFGQYPERLYYFLRSTIHGMHAAVLVGWAALVAALLKFRQLKKEKNGASPATLAVTLPAFPTLVVVAVISPVVELRYVYNILPFFAVLAALPVALVLRLPETRRALLAAAVLVTLWQARAVVPDYLYLEYRDYNAAAEAHSAAPCLYLDDNYFAPLTEDLEQLLYFDEVFVTGDPASPALKTYLEGFDDAREAVVYIDVSAFWSSGFNAQETLAALLEQTDFTSARHLYTTGLSETYLLTKE